MALALGAGAAPLDLPLTLPVAGGVLAWVGRSRGFIGRRWPIQWWMENTGSSDFFTKGGAPLMDQTAHVTALFLAAAYGAQRETPTRNRSSQQHGAEPRAEKSFPARGSRELPVPASRKGSSWLKGVSVVYLASKRPSRMT
ncbi:hypothetical protein [Streptomyces salinarius]|uniref:hypothetical protein n=1 Tax=Streptomyces salinarius TaxID=2762598 RepID=UPI003F482B45